MALSQMAKFSPISHKKGEYVISNRYKDGIKIVYLLKYKI